MTAEVLLLGESDNQCTFVLATFFIRGKQSYINIMCIQTSSTRMLSFETGADAA